VVDCIPSLGRVNSEYFASAFCSVNGQIVQLGDFSVQFSIPSISNIITYAYLYDLIGQEAHEFVGEEPSGLVFNAPAFDSQMRPHNPLVNAGAILICSLLVR